VPVALLQAIAETDETSVGAGLTRLQAAEFLYEVQLFPETEYTFKHALTHEVTYGTLLGDRRRTLHARLVSAIERLQAGRLDEQVDRLAQHAQRGEVRAKAATYAHQAGQRAQARGHSSLGAASFDAALAAAAHLPQNHLTQALSVDLNLGSGSLGRGTRSASWTGRLMRDSARSCSPRRSATVTDSCPPLPR
jgi:predicted ATPase